jgi:hypothetical protein
MLLGDEVESCGGAGIESAGDFAARHSNPCTGGESQLRFGREGGLGGVAEALWSVACVNSALLERATAERCAVLPW